MKSSMQTLLAEDGYHYLQTIGFLASNVDRYVEIVHRNLPLGHYQPEVMMACMKYVRRLKRCAMAHLMHFLLDGRYSSLNQFIVTFCTRALLIVFTDMQLNDASSFFAIIFDGRYAKPMVLEVRRTWGKVLFFADSISGAETASSVAMVRAASVVSAEERRQVDVLFSPEAKIPQELQVEAMSQYK
jgi:hypothetical protein